VRWDPAVYGHAADVRHASLLLHDNENLALSKRPRGLIVPAHAGVMGLRRLLRERDVPLAVYINDRQVGALDDVQIQNGKFRTLR
jgi:hypothetical protein